MPIHSIDPIGGKTLASNVKVTLVAPGGKVAQGADVTELSDMSTGSPIIDGTWATSEGGELTRERDNNWNGGESYDILVGKVTAGDITLTRPYRPVADDGWLATLRDSMRNGYPCYYTVIKQNFKHGNQAIGKPEKHLNCPVLTVRTFQAAAGPEATATTIELVLATQGPDR